MAKRKSRGKRKGGARPPLGPQRPIAPAPSAPSDPVPAVPAAAVAPPQPVAAEPARTVTEPRERPAPRASTRDYSYVRREIVRIVILAVAIIVTLVVLSFFLP